MKTRNQNLAEMTRCRHQHMAGSSFGIRIHNSVAAEVTRLILQEKWSLLTSAATIQKKAPPIAES
jgi:hypothetical protein